jgi:pyruvate dehydrogenase E1 component alpha subunit
MRDEPPLLELYRTMVAVRRFDEKAGVQFHGEEAVAVGAILALRASDYVVSTYHHGGHRIARSTGPDAERRFITANGVDGLPLATGVAMSIAYNETSDVVACMFGDEALSSGAFHESLNLASMSKLPVIFVCENNFFGLGTFVQSAVAQEHLHRIAGPYDMPVTRIDGMDVLEVYGAVVDAAAREGEGPSLIDAVTYRSRERSMRGSTKYCSSSDERVWRERDPIRTFRRLLLAERDISESLLDKIDAEVEAAIDSAAGA